jgi:hypothetical protein
MGKQTNKFGLEPKTGSIIVRTEYITNYSRNKEVKSRYFYDEEFERVSNWKHYQNIEDFKKGINYTTELLNYVQCQINCVYKYGDVVDVNKFYGIDKPNDFKFSKRANEKQAVLVVEEKVTYEDGKKLSSIPVALYFE